MRDGSDRGIYRTQEAQRSSNKPLRSGPSVFADATQKSGQLRKLTESYETTIRGARSISTRDSEVNFQSATRRRRKKKAKNEKWKWKAETSDMSQTKNSYLRSLLLSIECVRFPCQV